MGSKVANQLHGNSAASFMLRHVSVLAPAMAVFTMPNGHLCWQAPPLSPPSHPPHLEGHGQ